MKLRSHVTPMPFSMVEQIIQDTYGDLFDEEFESIDEVCLGSASIAQVHAATLKTKERVVLKIQRPKIYEWMERDVALLRKAVKILKKGHEMVFSTCSILKNENETNLKKAIDKKAIAFFMCY